MTLNRRLFLGSAAASTLLAGCSTGTPLPAGTRPRIDTFSDGLGDVLETNVTIETLAGGYGWSEGPVWDRARNCLYFTDVPGNILWRWSETDGATEFLNPSGIPRSEAGGFREPGANGLLIGQDGRLLICNHGKRAIEAMNIDTRQREILVGTHEGKKFSSPNDIIQAADGTIWFTDPPYGLEGLDASPLKETDVNGVYRLAPDGTLSRIIEDMTFPNGVALSPDESRLYITQSDPENPILRAANPDGTGASVLYDFSPFLAEGLQGLPDGLAVCESGHIFSSGPSGIYVIAPDGTGLGRINTGKATANCCFGDADGRTLYITSHDTLMRIRTKVRGLPWI